MSGHYIGDHPEVEAESVGRDQPDPGLSEINCEVPAAPLNGVPFTQAERDAAAIREAHATPPKGKRLARPVQKKSYSAHQRLMLLDLWKRSGLPATEFSSLMDLSSHTLYKWRKLFEKHGPSGLMDKPKGKPRGSRLSEVTKRTILMLKEADPDLGVEAISNMLARGEGLSASPGAIAKVLKEAGYEVVERKTTPHKAPPRRFERARPNQLWQTDIFTFMLKRQNRRVYLVAFMDDHSRFITCYAVNTSCTAEVVIDTLRTGITSFRVPEEVLTDNGPQYITWRGQSAFNKECMKRGIKQIVASPRRPQTLGKIERFWGTLWRKFIKGAIFEDLEDCRRRIGLFMDWYNFQRVHSGIDGLVPADRFFGAEQAVRQDIERRIHRNAYQLAQNGIPRKPFYLTGQVDGKPFTLHEDNGRVYLMQDGSPREEVEVMTPHKLEHEVFEPARKLPEESVTIPGEMELSSEQEQDDPLVNGLALIRASMERDEAVHSQEGAGDDN